MKYVLLFRRQLRMLCLCSLALALMLSVATSVFAQSSGGYDLAWNTFDGGGATFSTGGGYSLGGTIGQADAGAMSGGGYSLGGGFWAAVKAAFARYLPLVMRQP